MRLVIGLTSSFVLAFQSLAAPPVFEDLEFDPALERAVEQDRILIVDGTAEWCGPCKMMDRNVWVNPELVEWIEEHALAIQVDTDHQPKTSAALRIRAMPTIIAFREGEEFERLVGYQDTPTMLRWLEAVKRGESNSGPGAAPGRPQAQMSPMQQRLTEAQSMIQQGKFGEALEEYLWLWNNMLDHEPAMVGVRSSFMVSAMGELAKRYGPARAAFDEIRAELEQRVEAGVDDHMAYLEWMALCDALGQEQRVIEWTRDAMDDPQARQYAQMLGFRITGMLVNAQEWALLGRLHADPHSHVAAQLAQARTMVEYLRRRGQMTSQTLGTLLREPAAVYVGCLAADRDDAAQRVAEAIFAQFDLTPVRLLMVEWALEAGEPRTHQLAWLDEAEDAGASVAPLRSRVEEGLEKE